MERHLLSTCGTNRHYLDDLPRDVRDKLVVTPVDTLGEALAITLRDTTLRDGRLFHAPSEAVPASIVVS